MKNRRIPIRYQRKRTPGWKKPHKDVINVGRPSMWGNPFFVKKTTIGGIKWAVFFKKDRYSNATIISSHVTWIEATGAAISLFDRWFDDSLADPGTDLHYFRNRYGWQGFQRCVVAQTLLRGKDIMCWCDISNPCHGDVILRKVNK